MALRKCRECGREVSSAAKTCPHCGVGSPVRRSHWLGLLVALTVIVAIAASFGKDPAPSNEATTGPRVDIRAEAQARLDCQNAVTEKLRSPSTADFPYLEQHFTPINDTAAMLVGVVDAQNGFGATIRDDVTCTYRKRPTETVWTLHRAKLTAR